MRKMFKSWIKAWIASWGRFSKAQSRDWENPELILCAKTLMHSASWREIGDEFFLPDKEFRVYSQFGDDGIIQFLVRVLCIDSKKFIEFGVADFFESNTHFLLCNNNWNGFVLDGSQDNINVLQSSPFYWRYSLSAEAAFITKENINELLSHSGFDKLGLLHIDLDGNDYWILQEVDLARFRPDILILEYNALFGSDRAITVPYDPQFNRFSAHFSGQLFGASLPALDMLAREKGYYFVGCNSAGNNAYFLRSEYLTIIPELTLAEGFQDAKFRDSRDQDGNLSYAARSTSADAIRGLKVFNTQTQSIEPF